MRLIAAAGDSASRTPAGSASGPAITKWFSIKGLREIAAPDSTSAASPSGAWVSSTSALPSRPMRSAAPLPTATTRARTPVRSSKAGSSAASRPESRTLVVVTSSSVRSSLCLSHPAHSSRAQVQNAAIRMEVIMGAKYTPAHPAELVTVSRETFGFLRLPAELTNDRGAG